jgi:hypothetical protein
VIESKYLIPDFFKILLAIPVEATVISKTFAIAVLIEP